MLRYLIQRLCEAAVVLVLMSFVIYGLLGLMPGDPIDLMASGDPNITAADVARLKAIYGLDRPLLERYGHWLAAALRGDFGPIGPGPHNRDNRASHALQAARL